MKKKVIKPRRKFTTPKECSYCKENKQPTFQDIEDLQHLLTERGKIIGRARSGLCASHQKQFMLEVKYARVLALLSYTARD